MSMQMRRCMKDMCFVFVGDLGAVVLIGNVMEAVSESPFSRSIF